ncbi:MAG: glycosyltransferase [Planctomycetota bacterium]
MRVLHVMEATIGGTRRHITEVARGQNAAGLDVHLVVAAERQPSFLDDLKEMQAEGVGVKLLPMVRELSPRLDFAHARFLARHLRELAPDVVHAHSSKAGALGRWASLRTGIGRRVYTPHTYAFLFSALFSPAKRKVYRSIETWLARRTDRIVAVSEEEGATIRGSGVCDPDKVRVVPNGIDPEPYATAAPVSRDSLGVPPGVPLACVVGLVYEAKGQDLAVEALTRPGCEQLHLAIAGDGDRLAEFRDRARELGVGDRAHFLGWRNDVPALLAAADFLLLPSRWEAMPYIVPESLAARRPVVATRVDGVGGAVLQGETGLLAEIDDVESIAAACAEMVALGPDERARMGRRGHDLVYELFTDDVMVQRLQKVYEELL